MLYFARDYYVVISLTKWFEIFNGITTDPSESLTRFWFDLNFHVFDVHIYIPSLAEKWVWLPLRVVVDHSTPQTCASWPNFGM
jgi:hypothetical protein